ncbi:unnamed protein product [Meganyctiphanes norvegica]|uniref:KASH domain-containing protein n=1 Tax=Meganyctiphanes norvegica TaxID=48144 RepID=A0AAV2PZI3_MEGNR
MGDQNIEGSNSNLVNKNDKNENIQICAQEKDRVTNENTKVYTQDKEAVSNIISDNLKELEKKSEEEEDEQTIIGSKSSEEVTVFSKENMNYDDELPFYQDKLENKLEEIGDEQTIVDSKNIEEDVFYTIVKKVISNKISDNLKELDTVLEEEADEQNIIDSKSSEEISVFSKENMKEKEVLSNKISDNLKELATVSEEEADNQNIIDSKSSEEIKDELLSHQDRLENILEEIGDEQTIVDSKNLEEDALLSKENLIGEDNSHISQDRSEKKSEEDEQTIIDSNNLEESSVSSNEILNDEDDLLFSQDIESVIQCLTDDFEEEKEISPVEKSYGDVNESLDGVTLLDFPHVSIGFESRDRKSVSTVGSDIESDGELVPCEDKCIGTADFPDISYDDDDVFSDNMYNQGGIIKSDSDIILNLSLAKCDSVLDFRSQSIGENIDERPRSATSPSDISSSLAISCDCSEASLVEVSSASNTNSTPKVEDPVPTEIDKEKTPAKKVSKKKSKKNKRDIKSAESSKLDSSLLSKSTPDRPILVRGKQWKEKHSKIGKDILDSISTENESTNSPDIEDSSIIDIKSQDTISEVEEKCQIEVESDLIINVLPAESSNNSNDKSDTIVQSDNGEDIFVVRSCNTIVRQIVQTEYLVDSEDSPSSNDAENLPAKSVDQNTKGETKELKGSYGLELLVNTLDDIPGDKKTTVPGESNDYSIPGELLEESQCESVTSEPPIYFSGSKIDDDVKYDYKESFPKVIGTDKLEVDYDHDKFRTDFNARWSKNHDILNESDEDIADEPEHFSGEIVYEGPCSCGDNQSWAKLTVKDATHVKDINVKGMGVDNESHSDSFYHFDFKQGDVINKSGCDIVEGSEQNIITDDSKDIHSRIRDIVGSRLHKEGASTSTPIKVQDKLSVGYCAGYEDSPILGSSPASSSGVQGSDEMSPSHSRSQSCSREVSPTSTTYNIPDIAYETLNLKLGTTTPELLDNSPDGTEKVGYDFSTEKTSGDTGRYGNLKNIYQINASYTTDSEDPDDPNESDAIGFEPDPSATATSWVSTSEESTPTIHNTSTSSPGFNGTKTKKVPKVTRLLRETQGIVQRWEVLQTQAVERQRQSGQVRELQRQVKSLRIALEALRDRATHPHHRHDSLDTHDQLANSLQELKEIANEVASRKSDVSSLNLAVHRFLSDTGYSIAPLKDDVADLYRLWDEVNTRVTNEVVRLEGVETTWRMWEAQAAELRQALRHDQDTLAVLDQAIQTGSISDSLNASAQDVARLLNDRRKTQQPSQAKKLLLQHTRTQGVDITGIGGSSLIGEDCASDSGTSGYESCSSEELSERERRLAHLRRIARDLEASLSPQSEAWASITKTLSSAENELRGLQKHCRELVVRSAENLEQVKPSPVTRRRSWNKERGSRTPRTEKRTSVGSDSKSNSSQRGWMWRVVRAALPFQAALLLLFCVACLLEPNCCDHVNTLNLSFSPQTRYVHGPPPV